MSKATRWWSAGTLAVCVLVGTAAAQEIKNGTPARPKGAISIPPATEKTASPPAAAKLEPTPEERIRAALENKTDLAFVQSSLEEIAEYISVRHHIPAVIDAKALNDAQYDRSQRFDLKVSDTKLRHGLRLSLKQHELAYVITNDVLLFTTQTAHDEKLNARPYFVGDLHEPDQIGHSDPQELIDIVTQCIDPQSWKDNGGASDVLAYGAERLVVSNTQHTHEQLGDFFAALRRDRQRHPPAKAVPAQPVVPPVKAEPRAEPQKSSAIQLPEHAPLTPARQAAVSASNQFGIELYRKVAATEPKKNLLLAPLQISSSLGMTTLVANGETRAEIRRLLHWPEDDLENVARHEIRRLADELTRASWQDGIRQFQLREVFVGRGNGFLNEPYGMMERDYHTRIKAAELTQSFGMGHFRDSFQLGDTLKFTGVWQQPLRPAASFEPFFPAADKVANVNYVHISGRVEHAPAEDCRVVRLPYANSRFSFMAVLPQAREGLRGLESTLTPARLEQWLSALAATELEVRISPFTLRWHGALTQPLQELGMKIALNHNQADFENSNNEKKLWLSEVRQRTLFDFLPGSEVASLINAESAAASSPIQRILVNHPFLFLVMDNQSRAIILIGRYCGPQQEPIDRTASY